MSFFLDQSANDKLQIRQPWSTVTRRE